MQNMELEKDIENAERRKARPLLLIGLLFVYIIILIVSQNY